MKKYTRIRQEERNEIFVMLNKGVGVNEIARRLRRDKGAISREINKNHERKVYRANKAQERAKIRQPERHKKFVLKSYALRKEVEEMVTKHWSPEIVCGRLKLDEKFPTI
ncbi:MAG: helix-turn-helix domain-containing protein [Endomicrobium sp.]|jgi:IS30 family transposase|nr:helix-turn-helix domain-containing protein [Endomicrobium sp.]